MVEPGDVELYLRIQLDPSTQSPFLGFCFVDLLHRRLSLGQFHTSDASYSHLTDLLTLQPPSTLTLALDRQKIHAAAADRIKALIASHPSAPQLKEGRMADFKRDDDAPAEVERLAKDVAEVYAVKDKKAGLGAAGAAIKELRLLSDDASMGQWAVRSFELTSFMLIDPNASVALNLFPGEGDSDRHMSLFGLLNKGRTAMSSRLLTRWLRQPLTSLPLIQRRQRLLRVFVDSTQLRSVIREQHLHRLPDLSRTLRLFVSGKANLRHIVQLWQALARLPALIAAMEEYDGEGREEVGADFIEQLRRLGAMFTPIDALVSTTIDLKAASTGYTFQLNAMQPSLVALKQQSEAAWAEMQTDATEAEKHLRLAEGSISIQLRGEKSGEYVMRVNRTDEKALRGKNGYSTLSTNKDGVKFVTSRFSRAAKEYARAQAEYAKEERVLVAQAVEAVASYARVLEALIDVIAELDLLCALAHVCVNAPTPYVEPELLDKDAGIIDMKQARHPCMEVMEDVHFIPNDVHLQRGQSHLQIITGPNMGGKSTYIRMTGVVQLLAQMGMRVPCESARVSICDRILTRVGAGDAALKGLSTFMKEMTEASSILSLATAHSLIIIDELGRGTSTWDGFGLARSIAEYLARTVGAFCLMSTHFHEMTDMEQQLVGVLNQHVVVQLLDNDDGGLVMTHQVRRGASGKSFGVNVAKMANMPSNVLALATGMVERLEAKAEAAQRIMADGGAALNDPAVIPLTADEQAELDAWVNNQQQANAGDKDAASNPVKLSEALLDKLASFDMDGTKEL